MGIESYIGRFHFGKVEEEIYCHTVHCLVKRPSGNTSKRIEVLVNSHSSAWWPHANCIDQEGEWLKHALDEIRSGYDIDLNLKPRADFMATIYSSALYTCSCVGTYAAFFPISLNSSLLRIQTESNLTSTLFSANKPRLYPYSRLYKQRHALAAHCTVKAWPNHTCMLISCFQTISHSSFPFWLNLSIWLTQ